MFFIQFHVRPTHDSTNAVEYGGAYVNCWVARHALTDAMTAAMDVIHEAGWQVETVEQERRALRDEFDGDGLAYFDQAVVDGEDCVFHTWPVDAPDADEST